MSAAAYKKRGLVTDGWYYTADCWAFTEINSLSSSQDVALDELFVWQLCMLCSMCKVISGVKGEYAGVLSRGGVTLSADTVNFWSWMWSCGWPCGAVATLGSALGFLLQRKHRHVTPIMTYIKTSHYVSHREGEREREGAVRLKCHLSPFNWCLTMTSFAQAGLSPMGKEVWFTDCCSWLWLFGVLLPLPHSTMLCGWKRKTLCRENLKDQQHDMWVMFCFLCQPSTQ